MVDTAATPAPAKASRADQRPRVLQSDFSQGVPGAGLVAYHTRNGAVEGGRYSDVSGEEMGEMTL